ncbi:alpha/beta hydrolase [Streptomyces sp. NPDC048002]|uniref:RBBP9/YdeN family alpha/beta hydrolase n=1 Tax=unclassified Streptomyces TaxID=2593676 RepID=UPI00340E2E2F
MTAYLILHGWQNHRPEPHWQHWLADRLTALGHQVTYPQLPDADDPEPEVWLQELSRHLPGQRVVVAHSLSAVLWLHAAARSLPGVADVDRVLLVAPPAGAVLRRHPEVAAFSPPALDFRLPGPTRLVAGDDDPYCPEGARALFADPLGIPCDVLPGAAHLDLDAGYGPWPSVLDWCLGRTARLTANR